MANLPFSHVIAPADPNVEGVNSGMSAGSCYSVVGYATDVRDPKEQDITRTTVAPIRTQPIGWGGDNLVSGQTQAELPIVKIVRYTDSDFNDRLLFTVADTQAAPGAQYDTVNGGFNVGTTTVEVGEWLAGAIPQA